jgi:hypothetical protein
VPCAHRPRIGSRVSKNDDVSAAGSRSQFQPPSGHCQCSSRSASPSQRASAKAERHQRPQRVALLRGVRAVPAAHHRHAVDAVHTGLRGDLDVAVVRLGQPRVEHLFTKRVQRLVAGRVAEVGERGEHPVRALPLGVRGEPPAGVER